MHSQEYGADGAQTACFHLSHRRLFMYKTQVATAFPRLFPFLLFIALQLSSAAFEARVAGKLQAIDKTAGTLTVEFPTAVLTYRFRPSIAVTINNSPARVEDLQPGMTLSVASAEPGVATGVAASVANMQVAPPAAPLTPEAVASFTASLTHGLWTWGNTLEGEYGVRLRFDKDGTAAHRGLHAKWKIVSPNRVVMDLDNGDHMTLQFNPGVTKYEIVGRGMVGKRVQK